MRRLGCTRCFAQGGDVGVLVTDLMGRQAVEGLVGYHLNLLTAVLAIGDTCPRRPNRNVAAAAFATFKRTASATSSRSRPGPRQSATPPRLTDRAGGLVARPRHRQLPQDRPCVRRRAARGQPHPGQHPRQHHAVLADRHRRRRPGRTGKTDERWPQRSRAASLLRRSPCRSASPPSPVRSGPPRAAGPRRSTPASPTSTRSTGRPLRRLGGAGPLLHRGAGCLPRPALRARGGPLPAARARRGDRWLDSEPLGQAGCAATS